MKNLYILVLLFSFVTYGQRDQISPEPVTYGMVPIKGGEFLPLYGTGELVKVADFHMDIYPVTLKEFQSFVKENPEWKRSRVKGLFADEAYLSSWQDDENFGEGQLANAPATYVSWFAAKRYCECQGKRLPTVDEWEYVAMADQEHPDAREELSYTENILSWYETPNTAENAVGETAKNYWGVYDLYGLVWEWTMDFGSVMVTENSRDGSLYCDAGAATASDLMNYAAFMRYAFRGSMRANYANKNLGFRCVQDAAQKSLP